MTDPDRITIRPAVPEDAGSYLMLVDALAIYERAQLGQSVERGARPAILVVDFSCGFTDPDCPIGSDLRNEIAATGRLLEAARRKHLPVIFTTIAFGSDLRDSGIWTQKIPGLSVLVLGTRWVDIDPRLEPRDDETIIVKKGASAFFGTNLSAILVAQRIDTATAPLDVVASADSEQFYVIGGNGMALQFYRRVVAGTLTELPSIGDSIAAVITELHARGAAAVLDRLRARWPALVVELAMMPDVGALRARRLMDELAPRDLGELAAMAEAGRVRDIRGFGKISEAKLLAALRGRDTRGERRSLLDARRVSANLAGIPALSLPWGRTPSREDRPALPIGIQLMGPDFTERRLFEIARFLEREAPDA